MPGFRFPLVLRKKDTEAHDESVQECILISWCFVHGNMHGAAKESGDLLDVLLH